QGQYYQPKFVSGNDTTIVEGYVTDIITDKAIQFVADRDSEKPFCLLYHHKAPHRNWMPNVKDLKLFNDGDLPIPDTFFDTYENRPAAEAADMRVAAMYLSTDMKLHKEFYGTETGTGGNKAYDVEGAWEATYKRLTPEQKKIWDAHYDSINTNYKNARLKGDALSKWKLQRYLKDYLRCIRSVDDNIGRLLNYLDDNNLSENTIIVYTSDQGFYLGEHGWYDKRFMYEESLRTPLMIRYPKEVARNSVTEKLVQNIDYAPTFLDFAGVEIPEDMQGESLREILSGKETGHWRNSIYYHYYEYPRGWHFVKKHYGVRTDRYKLIHFYDDIDTWELYDLKNDPQELHNLYDTPSYKTIQKELHQELLKLRNTYGDI
ncbi:MAG: sulfatase/phosphatase domain-containing protein, partial [Saonia sp.]